MTIRIEGGVVYTQVFDVENRLTSVAVGFSLDTTTFAYDAMGQRVKTVKPDGDIIHYPFPFYEVKNPGQANEEIRKTYFLGGQTIALRVEADLYYFFTDHLGSTTRLSTSTGSAVLGSVASYLPFGGYRTTPTAGITDRGFTGHKHNDPLKLVYMNARYYVVGIGRFASADAIVPDPTNPQSFNRFGYVLNNPLKYIDPSGHCAFGTDENGNTIITKFDCTVDDFQALTWDERMLWVQTLVRMFDLGDWINDIGGVIKDIFKNDPDFSRMDGYTAYADAGILQALNDGWNLHTGRDAVGSVVFGGDGTNWTHGGAVWKQFFNGWAASRANTAGAPTLAELDRIRLKAEQAGVDYAGSLNESQRRFAKESEYVQIRIGVFTSGADIYRANCPCLGVGPRNGFSILSSLSVVGDYWAAFLYKGRIEAENPFHNPYSP